MRLFRTVFIAVALATTAAGLTASPSIAQDDGETALAEPGCVHDGAWALCPGVWLGSAGAEIGALTATQDGVTLTVTGDFLASFDVVVSSDGVASGSWLMDGDWTMDAAGSGVDGQARVASAIDGDITGSPGRLNVAGRLSNEGVFELGSTTQRISNSHAFSGLSVVVEGGTCIEAIGSWEVSWAALAADAGWNGGESITGDFTAIRQEGFERAERGLISVDSTEEEIRGAPIAAEVAEAFLSVKASNEAVAQVTPLDVKPTSENVNRLLDAADRTERAFNALANVLACEVSIDATGFQRWRKVATEMVVQTAVWAKVEGGDIDGTTLRRLVLRATATGAIGPASIHPGKEATEQNIASALSRTLEERTEVTGGSLSVKPEFVNEDTVELLRAAYESGLVLNPHGVGPVVADKLSVIEGFAARVRDQNPNPTTETETEGG